MRIFALAIKIAPVAGLALAACSGGTSQNAAAPEEEIKLQPGQWEMTTQITSISTGQDKAGEAMKPVTVSSCITADQVEKPQPSLFSASQGRCAYDAFYMSNGRLNFTMKCQQPGSSVASTVDGHYTATTLEAEVDTLTYLQDVNQLRTSAKLTGRRVGECTAAAATAKS